MFTITMATEAGLTEADGEAEAVALVPLAAGADGVTDGVEAADGDGTLAWMRLEAALAVKELFAIRVCSVELLML